MRSSRERPATESTPVLRSVAPGRSCIACRRRKIRCDRQHPCAYCTRLRTACTYPGDHDGSGASQQPSEDNSVLVRLSKVEESLRRLHERQPDPSIDPGENVQPSALASAPGDTPTDMAQAQYMSHHGRLVISESGRSSTYVDGGFWTALEAESEDWAGSIEQSDPVPSSAEAREPNMGLFVSMGASAQPASDLSRFHPRPDRVFPLWQVYLEAVDPLLKILHVPTTQRQLLQASQSLESIPPSFEALMFAIYYAAVTSMQTSVSLDLIMSDERSELLDKYGSGVEQALSKARIMAEPDIFGLQALTLFLVCARNHLDRSIVWTMTGTAIRLATKLGLHRDSVGLGLPSFDCEIRRRLWWQIVVLDLLTAQDNDMDPSICEHNFDTLIPHSIDDQALDITMSTPADDSPRRTEMLFQLRAIELARTARRVLFSDSFAASNGYPATSYEEKLRHVAELEASLKSHDEANLDESTAICSMTRKYTSMEIARMTLVLQHLAQATNTVSGRSKHAPRESKVIFNHLAALRTNDRQRRWLWLVQRDFEWDAAASLLHGLITTSTSEADQSAGAWQAVDEFFQRWAPRHYTSHLKLNNRWRLLKRLHLIAQSMKGDIDAQATRGKCLPLI